MENNDDNIEMWDWQDEDYGLQTNASNSLWSNVNENKEDLSYVFNETESTPAKSYENLAYQVTENDYTNKGTESCREAKRRRMLNFDNEVSDVDIFSDTYLKSKEREGSMDGALFDINRWVDGFADESCGSGVDQSSEGWLSDCLMNDTEMHSTTHSLNPSGSTTPVHVDLTESNNSQPTPTRQNIIFKGKKSYIKTPTKMASSVVLPFAFVKPCGMQGAVTLKDINQKILTPPPSKSKKSQQEIEKCYPTSAFSGKPVVGKTKIHTEGGKGSITIVRTKG